MKGYYVDMLPMKPSFYYFIKEEFLTIIVDVNECTEETDNCDDDATCTNTNGSFVCTCHQGYSGNGVTCLGMFFYAILNFTKFTLFVCLIKCFTLLLCVTIL